VQDRHAFGAPRTDTTINTLKDFINAVLTELAEIKGDGATTAAGAENDWFVERPSDLFASNQDRNAKLTEGGTITWSTATDNLTFSADLIIRIPAIAGTNTIQLGQSPINIDAAGKCAYVTLDRDTAGAANLVPSVAAYGAISADKDIFIIAVRGSDGRLYLCDGSSLSNGDSRLLGGSATPAASALVTIVDNVTYTSGDYNVSDYADASTCIQTAIDFVKTRGGTIYIRAGAYNIDAALSFAAATKNVKIIGDGEDTILTQDGAVNVFTIPQDIDDIQIEKLKIISDDAVVTALIAGVDNENVKLSELIMEDGAPHILAKLFISFTGNASGDVRRITINDCELTLDSKLGVGVQFDGYAEHLNIRDNKIYGDAVYGGTNAQKGIFIDDSADAVMGKVINISNNLVAINSDDQFGYGITIWGDYEEIVINNNFVYVDNDDSTTTRGINLAGGSRAAIIPSYSTITGNTVESQSVRAQATAFSLDGSSIANSLQYITVSGNVFVVEGTTPTYCAQLDDSKYISIDSNIFKGGQTYSLHMSNCQSCNVGVNQYSKMASYCDETNSFNVWDQICKGWVKIDGGTGNTDDSYNVFSTVRDGAGLYTVTWDRDFANANYAISAISASSQDHHVSAQAAGSCQVDTTGDADTYVAAHGTSVD